MTIPSCLERLVIEVPHLVDPTFCTGMIAQAEALGFAPATITTEDGTSVVPDIRNNDRLILDDPEIAGELWRLVVPSVAQPFKGQVAVGLTGTASAPIMNNVQPGWGLQSGLGAWTFRS